MLDLNWTQNNDAFRLYVNTYARLPHLDVEDAKQLVLIFESYWEIKDVAHRESVKQTKILKQQWREYIY